MLSFRWDSNVVYAVYLIIESRSVESKEGERQPGQRGVKENEGKSERLKMMENGETSWLSFYTPLL